ncbi:MAG: PAS domain S-box protein [Rhodocyclales bacterium]|nr:PAS domain S-box protein [Rhodocyclales bacterium]
MNDYASLSREQLIERLSALEHLMPDSERASPGHSRSDQEYRTIIQASMDGFWKIAADGRLLDCNDAACAMLGYRRDEMLALSIHDIDLLEDDARAAEHMRQIIARGHDRFETRHRRKDGDSIVVEVSAYCVPAVEAPLLFGFIRDISAGKVADEALRQSQERYRTVVDQQTDLIIRFLPDGTLTFVNAVACSRSGKTSAELIGRRWQPMVHPEDLPGVEAELRELAPGRPTAVSEIRFRTENGDLGWMQFASRAFFDDAGRLAEIQSVGRDITERKQTELALREMQTFKQAILDGVSAQVAVVDRRGVVVEVNAAWRRFAHDNPPAPGRLPCNVDVATNYLDICRTAAGHDAGDALAAASGIQAVLEGRLPRYEQEYPCHEPHAQRWFAMTVTPLERDGRGAVVSHHDISAPRRLAEELSMSDGRLRSILRSAPVGIGVLADRVFIEVNPAFCAMTGYATEELVGRSARMLYPTEADFERVGLEKYRQIADEGIGHIECRFLTKDGRIIDVALSSAQVVPGNWSRGVTFAAEDITARKLSEQQRFAQEARQREALIREVHHRIKNHLQGVLGLMANSIARHPELAEAMEAIFTRVNTIAKVYGLQGSKPHAHVRICDLMETMLEGTPSSAPIQQRNLSEHMEAILSPQEGVPMALVINELTTNADKHRRVQDVARPVQVSYRIESDKVTLLVTNAPASLPEGFDLASGVGTSTGLELLKALLPRTGASLSYRQEGDTVIAELVLVPPLVTCRARNTNAPPT